jgi:hypothetical protein
MKKEEEKEVFTTNFRATYSQYDTLYFFSFIIKYIHS